MPFEWAQFLAVARLLSRPPSAGEFTREAGLRSAVGRAYYAAFGHARTFAESEGFISLETSEDHGLLRLHFERTRRDDIARLLGDLRKWRNEADYRGSVPNLEMLARESIARADRIVRRLTEV